MKENRKKITILIVTLVFIISGIVLIRASYALFTTNQISKSAITIKAGTMNPTVKVNGTATTQLTVAAKEKKTFTVTLENLNNVSGKFLFYYLGTIPSGVKFGYLEEGVNIPQKENGVTLAKNGKNTYSLYVDNTSTSSITINLGSIGGLTTQPLSLPSNGHFLDKTTKFNITKIYKFDKSKKSTTYCITGEESTCQEINPAPSTYTQGTIVKYMVNNTLEKYFYVLADNGDTLTLLQRENTLSQIAWYTPDNDNSKGPLTAIEALENATSTWSNVLDQTYTLGTTIFKTNSNTGCAYNENNLIFTCSKWTYRLPERTAKARMITVQEAFALGCTQENQSCPVWMYNYLSTSLSNGGTVADEKDGSYHTLSAASDYKTMKWGISGGGYIGIGGTTQLTGVRAVVVINKE